MEESLTDKVVCKQCGAERSKSDSFCGSCGHRARGDVELGPGSVLGAYHIVELLGEGGMGLVFLAEHALLGRRVAIKMIRNEVAHVPGLVDRFFAEARAVNQIFHEHIVEITDFVRTETENYYVMELLRGEDLSALLERESQLPIDRSIRIGAQVADAMAAVHSAGIIHRDLKPENIFLTEKGGRRDFVKLLDFGIAKFADGSTEQPTYKTSAGTVLGTPDFMSPEQCQGKVVTHSTDIYALGVILYRLIAGRLPFVADSLGALLMMQMTDPPPDIASVREGSDETVPPELSDLIMRCLAKEPSGRPQSMAEVHQRLLDIADRAGMTEAYPRMRTQSESHDSGVYRPATATPTSPATKRAISTAKGTASPDDPSPSRRKKLNQRLAIFVGVVAVAIVALAVVKKSGGSDADARAAAGLASTGAAVTDAAPAAAAPAIAATPTVAEARIADAGLPDAAPLPPDAAPARVQRKPHRAPAVTRHAPVRSHKPAAFGYVAIQTLPYTEVFEGRKRLGETPLRVKLPVGAHKLILVNKQAGVREVLRVNVRKDQAVVKKLRF